MMGVAIFSRPFSRGLSFQPSNHQPEPPLAKPMAVCFDRAMNYAQHWDLDPDVQHLNHGSFGACPRVVLEAQQELRAYIEQNPMRFYHRELEERIDEARSVLAEFVGSEPENLVFVRNTTMAVNSVLRSLALRAGDELLVTDHEYRASRNALDFVAARSGAKVVVAKIPFPLASPQEVLDILLTHASDKTRLLLCDHITSATGLVLPIQEIVRAFDELGIDTLVDGAHAPGQLPLCLDQLGAAYYTGNCHKWLCTPKGAALLHVRPDRQEIRPLSISHGATIESKGRSRFWLEFDWTGTDDPTALLTIPHAIRFFRELLPGGWNELRRRNRELLLFGRTLILDALGTQAPCPDDMLASLAAVVIPSSDELSVPDSLGFDPLQIELATEHKIEVPVFAWPSPACRILRISAQLYNHKAQYAKLAEVLAQKFGRAR